MIIHCKKCNSESTDYKSHDNLDFLYPQAGLSADDIGIITPYRGQVKLVKKLLAQVKGEEEEAKGKRVEVNTVDQYQGRDKMAIICTFVRCGKTNDKVCVCFHLLHV